MALTTPLVRTRRTTGALTWMGERLNGFHAIQLENVTFSHVIVLWFLIPSGSSNVHPVPFCPFAEIIVEWISHQSVAH